MTYSSRKRSRSCEQDVSEFSPISKRINNIHIRSNGTKILNVPGDKSQEENGIHDVHGGNVNGENQGHHQSNHYSDPNSYQRLTSLNYMDNSIDPQQPSFSGQHQVTNCHNSTVNNAAAAAAAVYNSLPNGSHQWMGGGPAGANLDTPLPFEPELDERQNPIYYQVNEMLYQLHVERVRRMIKHPPLQQHQQQM